MVPNHYEDAIVCCVRENPEPVVFKVCCDAFRPELDLDRKQLHFDRVLLHRYLLCFTANSLEIMCCMYSQILR